MTEKKKGDMKLEPGVWYTNINTDEQNPYWMKVLTIGKETLEVVDEQGNRRLVGRWSFETTMKEGSPKGGGKGKR